MLEWFKRGGEKNEKNEPFRLDSDDSLIIGGLNWGLVGFFKFDLVAAIFGDMAAVSRVVYALVGLSALYMLFWNFMMMGENKTEIGNSKNNL